VSFTDVELAPAAERGTDDAGQELGPEEIAQLLERWRPEVLRRMRSRRLWRNTPPVEHEDQFQDVALVLYGRRFSSEDHLRRALWTGLGFRARDFWKSARRRETCVGDFYDDIAGDDGALDVEHDATIAADLRQVDDCLSELEPRERAVYRLVKGEELSRRRTAQALGISEADVLRALYSAQRKVDQFVLLLVSGRLCARRASGIHALASSAGGGAKLEQARAHLSHCQDCLAAYRAERAALGRRVAAVVPPPPLITATAGSGLFATVKQHLYAATGRTPGSTSEAAAGSAGGLALGTKVAATFCAGAVAGGVALCANTVPRSTPPQDSRHSDGAERRLRAQKPRSPARATPLPASAAGRRTPSRPSRTARSSRSTKAATAAKKPEASTEPEFFGGGSSGSADDSTVRPASTTTSTKSSSPAASSNTSSSSGSDGEFFGG
jgi:RNA polymerase sigma factor (sigma-70 family)